ncbi:hypothetical protein ACFL1I_08650 [Candidatus Omnitrophota bacterium]
MFPGRRPTPEKQLLNLIEQSKAGKEIKPQAQKAKFRMLSLFSLSGLRGRFSFFKARTASSAVVQKWPPQIETVNKLLLLVAISLSGYTIFSFSMAAGKLKNLPDLTLKPQAAGKEFVISTPTLLKKLPYYLEQTRERDMFNPAPDQPTMIVEGQGADQRKVISAKLAEAQQNLQLAGIGVSATGEPDAMIKDVKMNKVYFLKRGELVGDLKVEAIFQDKVLLSYEDEELILK